MVLSPGQSQPEKKIGAWIARHGFRITYKKDASDMVCFHTRRVFINASQAKDRRVAALLHEAGHINIYVRREARAGVRIASSSSEEETEARSRSVEKIATLHEEIEAWDKGNEIGRRLRIRINDHSFTKLKARCVMTYVRWAAGKKIRCKR